ncbi:MAG: TIM44-like domain-containing protein [Planctomycetota bacterium]|jgi:predicted lipid-binding transport protein (Tim44 family)/tellurite resistance protein
MTLKSLFNKFNLMMIFILCLIAFSEYTYGRAGGGRSFSSSRSFSSGRSYSGRSSSFSFGTRSGRRRHTGSSEFSFMHVIIIVIFIAIAIYRAKQELMEDMPARTIARANQIQQQSQYNESLELLQNKDPGFDETAFTGRVENAFRKIQDSWCAHDLSDIRPFVSDGIFERFSLQIAEQKEQHIKDHMEDLSILSCRIVHLASDNVFDTLTVKIKASAVDYTEDLKTGKKIDGSRRSEKFIEYWSFLRKPGVQTLEGDGLIEGNCPNCGAGLQMNQAAKCEACGSLIKNGDYDWVLAEITQGSEWSVKENIDIPGLNSLTGRDPEFSIQALEDTASVMFYRQMTSWRTKKIGSLKKVASEEYCSSFQERLNYGQKGTRTFPVQAAVGSVETLGIAGDGKTDTALCLIRWSASRMVEDKSGKTEKQNGATISNHVFFISRSSSAKTGEQDKLSSSHCPSCGAPESASESNSCEYCGAALGKEEASWVLTDVQPMLSPKVSEMRRSFRQVQAGSGVAAKAKDEVGTPGECISGGAEAAAWMIQVMLADGVIDAKEQKLINSFAEARGVPADQINMLIEAMKSGELEAPKPNTKDEAREWIEAMAAMALADGRISPEEKEALTQLGRKLNYSPYDINMIITKKRTELYQRAQTRIKHAKRMKMKKFSS